MTIKNLSFRPHDLVYDPLFVTSGPRDHYKFGIVAKMALAKYQVCPVFPNMFSDLPNYPRKQLVLRKTTEVPTYEELHKKRSNKHSSVGKYQALEVFGNKRFRYFDIPIVTYPSDVIPCMTFPAFTLKKVPSYIAQGKKVAGGKMHQNIQTDFRDSSMQTSPWQPSCQVIHSKGDGNESPHILKLDFLKWGSGLPAGKHEITLIERARMKRAWEKHLPPITDEATLQKRRDIIDAMERDEWAFREQEIEEIQDLRMKLLEKMLSEMHQKSKARSEMKLRNIAEIKFQEKNKQVEKLKKKTERELRKLEFKHRGISTKYKEMNIVDAHAHPKSELYAPLMRHGEHPMRWHQVLDEKLKTYKTQYEGVENFNTLPKWLEKASVIKDDYSNNKFRGTRICQRETKWTTPVLKNLHEELKNLHKPTKQRCGLRVKIAKSISVASTPETEELPEFAEDKYQAIISIQSLLKGRASQMLIYEGRDKCRELIKELKFSQGLLEEQREEISQTRLNIKNQQRDEATKLNHIAKLQKSLNKLEGSIVGSLLDFLNKELRRLLDERRAHAICFLNERERNDREAAEAGRRQQEIRRRREHDEMFKQMIKVHQDTVDLYLQNIITEGMEFASNEEAESYLKKLSKKIEDDEAEKLEQTIEVNENEELIADLVHHFILPEVQKQMIRSKMKGKQEEKLKLIHKTLVDGLITNLKKQTTEGTLEDVENISSTGFDYEYGTQKELIEEIWQGEPEIPILEDAEIPNLNNEQSQLDDEEIASEFVQFISKSASFEDEDLGLESVIPVSDTSSISKRNDDPHEKLSIASERSTLNKNDRPEQSTSPSLITEGMTSDKESMDLKNDIDTSQKDQ